MKFEVDCLSRKLFLRKIVLLLINWRLFVSCHSLQEKKNNYRTFPYISPPKYKPMGLYLAGGLTFGDKNYRELGKQKLGIPRIYLQAFSQ